MDMTDNQRRWWFATHPEYRRSRRGNRRHGHIGSKDKPKRVDPKQVDEYVDHALQYVHGPVAEILKSTKRNFGTGTQPGLNNGLIEAEKPMGTHQFYSIDPTDIPAEEPGLEEDWEFYFNAMRIARILKAPVAFVRSLLRSQAPHTILNAVKGKGTGRPPRLPPKGTREYKDIENARRRGIRAKRRQERERGYSGRRQRQWKMDGSGTTGYTKR